jgi:hypothetical protein
MMADLSGMSDADLDAAIAAQQPDLSKMSDADLDAAIAKARNSNPNRFKPNVAGASDMMQDPAMAALNEADPQGAQRRLNQQGTGLAAFAGAAPLIRALMGGAVMSGVAPSAQGAAEALGPIASQNLKGAAQAASQAAAPQSSSALKSALSTAGKVGGAGAVSGAINYAAQGWPDWLKESAHNLGLALMFKGTGAH